MTRVRFPAREKNKDVCVCVCGRFFEGIRIFRVRVWWGFFEGIRIFRVKVFLKVFGYSGLGFGEGFLRGSWIFRVCRVRVWGGFFEGGWLGFSG